MEQETVWLNQTQMTLLFQRDVSVISRHIRNIFEEGELQKECNLHFLQIANSDKPVAFYSLDVIISVGYRIKSKRGTEFRIWATQVLKEYLYRGYAIYQRMNQVENQVAKLTNQVQTIVQTALPPKQGIFFDGQIFDACSPPCMTDSFSLMTAYCTLSGLHSKIWGRNCFVSR